MNTKDEQQVLRKILVGVYVVGAVCDGKINGMTAAWVSQVSFNPALIMVAVGGPRYTHQLIEKSGVFSLSVLSENQVGVAKHFGSKSGRDTDKFAGVPYETYSTGAPVLKDCAAYLDCKVVGAYKAGDHTLFIGEIAACGIKKETNLLIYHAKDYFG